MNNSETRALIEDLFADPGTNEFRATAMSSMLGAVRRKRRIRQVRNLSALVLILTGASLAWWFHQPAPTMRPPIASTGTPYELVVTKAFAVERVVRTQAGVRTIASSLSEGYAVIQSLDSQRFVRQLDDEGLLGMFAGRAVALVYRGPGEVQLVLPDEDPVGRQSVQ